MLGMFFLDGFAKFEFQRRQTSVRQFEWTSRPATYSAYGCYGSQIMYLRENVPKQRKTSNTHNRPHTRSTSLDQIHTK